MSIAALFTTAKLWKNLSAVCLRMDKDVIYTYKDVIFR